MWLSPIKNNETVPIYFLAVIECEYLKNRKYCRPNFKLFTCVSFIEFLVSKFPNNRFFFKVICYQAIVSALFLKVFAVSDKILYSYIDKGLPSIKNIDLLLKLKCFSKSSCVSNNKKILGAALTNENQRSTNVRKTIEK